MAAHSVLVQVTRIFSSAKQLSVCLFSSGKKGRNVAVDSMQSIRGGSVDVASARVGQHEKVSAVQVQLVWIARVPFV